MSLTPDQREGLLRRARQILKQGLTNSIPSLIIIARAGVSMATTGAPSWIRFLNHGCDYAEEALPKDNQQVKHIRDRVSKPRVSTKELVEAGDEIKKLLGPNRFAQLLVDEFARYRSDRSYLVT